MKRLVFVALLAFAVSAFAVTLIQIKRGSGAPGSLQPGEPAVDLTAMDYYIGNASSNAVKVGSAAWSNKVDTTDNRNLQFSNLTLVGSLTLSNTTWDDLRIPMSTAMAGVSVPNYSAMTNGIFAWHFVDAQTDTLYFETQLPHNYAHGSDLNPHVHWSETTPSTNSVVWQFEYSVCSINSNFPASTTLTITAACQNVALRHQLSSFGTISGEGLRGSAVLVGRISRLGTDGGDTYTGDAIPLSLDIHYQQDKVMGSDNEIPGP